MPSAPHGDGGSAGRGQAATSARLDAGDPLRALAALGVVGLHAIVITLVQTGYFAQVDANRGDYFATLFGPLGHGFNGLLAAVDVFFVLSAYLLARPFLRAFVGDQPLPSIRAYLRNRALRVLPAFWFVLLVVVLVAGRGGESWLDVLGLAALLDDFTTSGLSAVFGQPWSLSVEVRFYLLLPAAGLVLFGLKRLLGPRLPRGARIALVAVLVAGGYVASSEYAIGHPDASFAANGKFFAPGIALALLEYVVPGRARGRRGIGRLAALIFVAGCALTLGSYSLGFPFGPRWMTFFMALGAGAVVAGPLVWQWSGRDAWRILDNRVLHWIGRRSYPLFLIHELVITKLAPPLVVGGYKSTLLLLWPAGLGVSLLCADLIHRFVERPALRYKRAATTVRPVTRTTAAATWVAPTDEVDRGNLLGAANAACERAQREITEIIEGVGGLDAAIDAARRTGMLVLPSLDQVMPGSPRAAEFVRQAQTEGWRLLLLDAGADSAAPSGDQIARFFTFVQAMPDPEMNGPLPPAPLRRRVGGGTVEQTFRTSGQLHVDCYEAALAAAGVELATVAGLLEWGAGAGRMTAHLVTRAPAARITAVDTDAEAIAWVGDNLAVARAAVIPTLPPTELPDDAYDLVIGHSVFTHLDVESQDRWLAELARVIRPGGHAALSFNGAGSLSWHLDHPLADVPASVGDAVTRDGIGIWRGDGWENEFYDGYHTTFHAHAYVQRHWSQWFDVVSIHELAAMPIQDIAVLRARERAVQP